MAESLKPPFSSSSSSSSNPKLEMPGKWDEESLKSFPDELIIEILTWLPAKTLLRFRCVSKSWQSVISSPKFIKAHLKNSSGRDDCAHHRVFFRGDKSDGELVTRYFPLAPALFGDVNTPIASTVVEAPVMATGYTRIAGAANGILCVRVIFDIFFWNPAIRKFKKLPVIPTSSNPLMNRKIMFCYNDADDDYQVCVIDLVEKWVSMYSGKTNSWKKIRGFLTEPSVGYFFVRGRLYWIKKTTRRMEICYIDLKTETRGVQQQPDYGNGTFTFLFGVVEGCLAICCYDQKGHADLWILKEQSLQKSWTKVLLFTKLKELVRKMSCMPIFMSKDGKMLFVDRKIVALSDPMKKSVKYPRVKSLGDTWKVEVVVESLLLMNDHDAKEPVKETIFLLSTIFGTIFPISLKRRNVVSCRTGSYMKLCRIDASEGSCVLMI